MSIAASTSASTSATAPMATRAVGEDAVLDAAAASLLAVGVRRTTLTDVARRAGVSRMTLYRRWPDLRTLVGDVMTRQWSRVVAASRPAGIGGGGRGELVAAIVATTEAFRADPLFRKIVGTDPELLLPYVLDRRGAAQDQIVALLESDLGRAQTAGVVRAGDPAALARTVLLVVQSFVLSADALGAGVPPESLTRELHRLLDRYLAPDHHAAPDHEALDHAAPEV